MTLQQQLEYFWERGFYSVVKDTEATSLCYFIISTKDENGRFRESEYSQTVEDAKLSIGANPGEKLGYLDYMDNWKIVDTIHPSELMGKGFQVGDKVTINLARDSDNGKEGVVESFVNDGTLINVRVRGILLEHIVPTHLKPVLPVEEKEHDYSLQRYSHTCDCGQWDSQLDKNNIDTLYAANFAVLGISSCNGQYVLCPRCKQKVRKNAEYQAIKVLTESGLITDDKIVNL